MAEEEVYPLQRHTGETIRLNKQNQVLIDVLGYVIHPVIQRLLPSNPKVAEPGTGTGALLVSISKEIPGAQLHGFDITDVAFPPTNERPSNLTLSLGDIKKPPPAEHVGKYDLVCMRFLNAAFEAGEDWTLASAHALSLLKPGGALQWMDGNFSQVWPVLQSDAATKTDVMEKCALQALTSLQHAAWFTQNLKHVLESVGFEGVVQKVMSTDRSVEMRSSMSEIVIGALYAILRGQAKGGKPGAWQEAELDALLQGMRKEVDAGAYFRCDLHQFVAFKPKE